MDDDRGPRLDMQHCAATCRDVLPPEQRASHGALRHVTVHHGTPRHDAACRDLPRRSPSCVPTMSKPCPFVHFYFYVDGLFLAVVRDTSCQGTPWHVWHESVNTLFQSSWRCKGGCRQFASRGGHLRLKGTAPKASGHEIHFGARYLVNCTLPLQNLAIILAAANRAHKSVPEYTCAPACKITKRPEKKIVRRSNHARIPA